MFDLAFYDFRIILICVCLICLSVFVFFLASQSLANYNCRCALVQYPVAIPLHFLTVLLPSLAALHTFSSSPCISSFQTPIIIIKAAISKLMLLPSGRMKFTKKVNFRQRHYKNHVRKFQNFMFS